jgi:S1-C subfamily serine protease
MRRLLEYLAYGVVILYFIGRYANVDLDDTPPRRPLPHLPPGAEAPPVLVPEGMLPRDDHVPVTVELDREVKNGVGTAFAVDGNGTYVTARHVVDGCRAVYLVVAPRRLEKVLSARSERSRDFAVLQTPRTGVAPFSLTTSAPKRGDEGFMMGFPQGKPADVRASVIGRSEMRSVGRYSMREPVIAWVEGERRPGFGGSLGGISGGPVLNAAGEVIGTVVAGAPRRGRVYTTHPRVFEDSGLLSTRRVGRAASGGVHRADFDAVGTALRSSLSIAQVYCRVT